MSVAALASESRSHSDRLYQLLEKTDYRVAVTDQDREAIFRLRYDAYTREKAILPDFSRRLSDQYDDLDNTTIVGLHIDGELAGTIRVSVATAGYPQLPAMEVFPDIIQPLLGAGKTIIDPTRFAANNAISNLYPGLLPYMTTRVPWLVAGYFKADLMLAAVRPEHQAFYRRIMSFKTITEPAFYPKLTRPNLLMTCDYPVVKEAVELRYPIFRSTAFERRMLMEWPGSPFLPKVVPAIAVAAGA